MKGKTADYVQAIRAVYPDLSVQNAHTFDHDGQYSDILVVNDEFMFRFPRYAEGIRTIGREVQILKGIQGRTTLAVPNPIFSVTNPAENAKVFMGYQMIGGDALWRPNLDAQNKEVKRRWAEQLAGFLLELHSIPPGELGRDLPLHEQPGELEALWADFRHYLYPVMRSDARRRVNDHFEAFLNSPELQSYSVTLRHGDFGLGNILYDPDNLTITGIIDFSFAGLGDPALDIAAASTLGPELFDHFQRTYPDVPSMMGRANFYRGTFALYEALHGIKNDDRQAFESGIATYI